MMMARIAGLLSCLLWASAALAAAPDGATIAQQGNKPGAAPCMACHGADGGGRAPAGFPRLAGLPHAYLRKQLDDFANGTRVNAIMQPASSALNDAERDAVAKYYSSTLPLPAPTSPAPLDSDAAKLGQMLATRGRWSDSLPACEQCHGPGGIGVGDHFPPLTGQPQMYIANTLNAWKQGARHNDPLQLMQNVAAHLSDKDIEAVSAWYMAQPIVPAKEQQP
jgi:cytochrome c553